MNVDVKTRQRLRQAALFALVRGLAAATGGAIVTTVVWWVQR